jgi:uncharacterized protein YggE
MATKRGRVGRQKLHPVIETPATPCEDASPAKTGAELAVAIEESEAMRSREQSQAQEQRMEEDTNVIPTHAFQAQSRQLEGVAVVGEAVRRVPPESAEFLIEVTVTSASIAQALKDQTAKVQQLAVAAGPMGIQSSDLQTVSMNVYNLYPPGLPGLPSLGAYGAMQQIGPTGPHLFGGAASGSQPGAYSTPAEVQFGSYQVRSVIRVLVREVGRVGEVIQTAIRAGAIPVGPLSFRASDESDARRAVLEAAGRDAKVKAETLARSLGKNIGDAITVTEEVILSNGAYSAFRSTIPGVLGSGAIPAVIGELEYYARVSANFRFQ